MTLIDALCPQVEVIERPYILVNVKNLRLGNGHVLHGRFWRQVYTLTGQDGARAYYIYRSLAGDAVGYAEVS
jgi:hypothetical protein